MNRIEEGEAGARLAQGTPISPTAAATAAGAPGLVQTAPILVGPAGNLLGTAGGACACGACGPQMFLAAGYGPMRTGGLMDPRNYGEQGFLNQGQNGNEQQNQQETGACGFAWPGGSVGQEGLARQVLLQQVGLQGVKNQRMGCHVFQVSAEAQVKVRAKDSLVKGQDKDR